MDQWASFDGTIYDCRSCSPSHIYQKHFHLAQIRTFILCKPEEIAKENQFYYSCWHGFRILWPWHTKCPRTRLGLGLGLRLGLLWPRRMWAVCHLHPWHRIQRTTRRATHRIYYFICISYKSHGYVTHMHKTPGSGRCEFLPITDYKRVQTRRLDGVGGLLGPGVWALGTRAIVQRQAQICINFQ